MSLAIKYKMKQRAKKMANSGAADPDTDGPSLEQAEMLASPKDDAADAHAEDMVTRIMKRHAMSKGGMVANEGEDELSHMADGKDNELDFLASNDELEFSDTGANSGDELGDAQEEDDRKDTVSRIMKSRSKKDKMPRPA